MDSYIVKPCTDCGLIFSTLDRLNRILSKYAKNKYQNNAYLVNKVFPKNKIKLLSRYRDILEDLTWNGAFYEPYFTAETIISRVKLLTNGL